MTCPLKLNPRGGETFKLCSDTRMRPDKDPWIGRPTRAIHASPWPGHICRSCLGMVRAMTFEADLEQLHVQPDSVPQRQMRMRYEHRTTFDSSLAELARGEGDDLVLALYPLTASTGSRPVVVVHADPSSDLLQFEQGAVITAWGWPEVGRAVVVETGRDLIERSTRA